MLLRLGHIKRAVDLGFCESDLILISGWYDRGYDDGETARQSCSPPEILESNLIRDILVGGIPEHFKKIGAECERKVIELMARAYYDGYNERVREREILSSEYFPLE
ncbi:MAG: hypothetical protein V1889_01690 [archaeon]